MSAQTGTDSTDDRHPLAGPPSNDHGDTPRDDRRNGNGNGSGQPPDERDGSRDGDSGGGRERKRPGKKPLIILGIVVALLLIVAFVWWFATRNQESTDDAYTDGNVVMIAPKVSGYVVKLNIDDNVYVHAGDLLVVIDKRDYQAQVDAARAQLGLASAQLNSALVQLDIARVQYPAQYREAKAQTSSAEASLRQALAAHDRQHAVDQRATSQQAIDAADAQWLSARSNVIATRAQMATARLVPQKIRQAQAAVEERRQQVQQAQARLEQAQLDLSYCEVRAPSDGWITRRNVQLGSFLQAGTSMFSIVTPQRWVTANFKETQLDRMRAGDKVKIEVDAYPDLDLRGHVQSVQLGSGSRFSAFPAENATGNFVKIVQRVPVKIVIDSRLPKGQPPLGLGLSVTPKVYLK